MSRTHRRIVTCQGSIQLVAATAARRHRLREENQRDHDWEDYLVIYNLAAPSGQDGEFVQILKEMATCLGAWKRIVYFSDGELSALARRVSDSAPRAVFQRVYERVGTAEADELFLGKDWQIGNVLFMNAYRAARQVCYGDGIGMYLTEDRFNPSTRRQVVPARRRPLRASARRALALLRHGLERRAGLRISVEPPRFDIGYMLLPDAFTTPPMPTVRLDRHLFSRIFDELRPLITSDDVAELRRLASREAVSVLLTSNFTEGRKMTREAEIEAYREFVVRDSPARSILVIKPHPRDDRQKIEQVRAVLSREFDRVIVLTDPGVFFLPFEVVFREVLLQPASERQRPAIFTVSTACLSLEAVMGVRCHLGFGDAMVRRWFAEDWVESRVRHERELREAVNRVRAEFGVGGMRGNLR
jgi:hypothetical protein